MELRVWVDGTQRVVCGVKLTTTCQEIVFALAHATQQAGRFTMIERWRNNERLLSPNEQPLVTLQRWGERMNEVEFILKKTSTDPQPQTNRPPVNHIPPLSQQTASSTTATLAKDPTGNQNDNDTLQHQPLTNGQRESPADHMATTSNHNSALNDKASDLMFQQTRNYNLNRRPQTVLGPLTSSSSALNLGAGFMQSASNRFSNQFRPSLSASTLPNVTNGMSALPANPATGFRPRYLDDAAAGTSSPSLSQTDPHNGYQIQSDPSQHFQPQIQSRIGITTKNYPYEDLYSTINKKRNSQLPPAVPAKPRMVNPAHPQQTMQANNNAQMNYYQPNSSPHNMYPNNMRPRHPPGYLEYLEAMANRNSLPPSFISNPNYLHQSQHLATGNSYTRQFDQQQHQLYNILQNGASPASSSTSNQHYYPTNGQVNRSNLVQSHDLNTSNSLQNINHPINPKFVESSGLVINRGSAVNVRLPSNSQQIPSQNAAITEENLNTSSQSNASAVSQMGLDMLKVIEEQKKLLMNQKSELERLDNDQEYLEAKQSSEQAELIKRIESEIRQLEDLWRENQAQINKLENQNFDKELEQLKSEQVRMELEIVNQKSKLSQCENDIVECNNKIEQLEAELDSLDVEAAIVTDTNRDIQSTEDDISKGTITQGTEESRLSRSDTLSGSSSNATSHQSLNNQDSKSSGEDEDDSSGDASDDLSTKSRLRSTKEVSYVEKRGLISGIRSLKLDKSRSLNKSIESLNSTDSPSVKLVATTNSTSISSRDKPSTINNNILDGRCMDTNGQQFKEKTANSNKYEFLMTL